MQFYKIIKNFEDYKKMVDSESDLIKILDDFINDVSIVNDNDNDQVLESLVSLKELAIDIPYSKKNIFYKICFRFSQRKRNLIL